MTLVYSMISSFVFNLALFIALMNNNHSKDLNIAFFFARIAIFVFAYLNVFLHAYNIMSHKNFNMKYLKIISVINTLFFLVLSILARYLYTKQIVNFQDFKYYIPIFSCVTVSIYVGFAFVYMRSLAKNRGRWH